jgi:hypothetical protein
MMNRGEEIALLQQELTFEDERQEVLMLNSIDCVTFVPRV